MDSPLFENVSAVIFNPPNKQSTNLRQKIILFDA